MDDEKTGHVHVPTRRTVLTGLAAGAAITAMNPSEAGAAPAKPTATSPRQEISLNDGWRFQRSEVEGAEAPAFDASTWSSVSIPHTWNAKDGQDGGSDYYRGAGWYRRSITISKSLAGKRLFLQFDGANTVTDVYLNGVHVGQHKGGYAAFRFDVTDVARLGSENVLAVRVTNASDPDVIPRSADYTFFGGIYRPVSLQIVNPVHVDMTDYAGPGVYLTQRDVSAASATVEVTTRLANDSLAAQTLHSRTTFADASGAVVRRAESVKVHLAPGAKRAVSQSVHLQAPELWNGTQNPYQYSVSVEVVDAAGKVVDVVTQPLGLRSTSVTPSRGFSLNGNKLHLRGVNRHQDRLDKGWALTDAEHSEDMQLIHEMGANALRTAHYQQAQRVYDEADRLGIVVYTEIPFVGWPTDTTSSPDSEAFRANVKQQMRELIRQTYNHPSVVFLGIGNELQVIDDTPWTNQLLTELTEIIRTEAPGRISGYAAVFLSADEQPLHNHAQVSGYNRYEGWYSGTTDMWGIWADALHARNPWRSIGLTEYGVGTSVNQHEEAPTRAQTRGFQPEEYGNFFHESYLKQIEARSWLWGTFVWNMFDFAVDNRNEGDVPGRNTKGLATYDRKIKKDAYYWYQVNWTETPVTYITSRRWTERTEPKTEVKVYSNADTVTLSLNGVVLGSKTAADHIHKWPVTLTPGVNTVVATSVVDGRQYTDTVTWNLAG